MGLITILLIAISLSMDAFAVAVSNGICIHNFSSENAFKQGIYFGLFQFLMPLLGYFLGSSVKNYIEAIDHFIAFGLLSLIGINMIIESIKSKNEIICENTEAMTNKTLIIQAIATSIDALAVGISFAVLETNIIISCSIIGIVAFTFSFFGGILGKKAGKLLKGKAEILGGIILIFIGTKILIEHLFL